MYNDQSAYVSFELLATMHAVNRHILTPKLTLAWIIKREPESNAQLCVDRRQITLHRLTDRYFPLNSTPELAHTSAPGQEPEVVEYTGIGIICRQDK